MALTAGADIAFAFAVGGAALGLGGTTRARVMRVALLVWLVLQGLYLPLQASVMSGAAPDVTLPIILLVITRSHFGAMWLVGVVAGIVALALAFTTARGRTTWSGYADHCCSGCVAPSARCAKCTKYRERCRRIKLIALRLY